MWFRMPSKAFFIDLTELEPIRIGSAYFIQTSVVSKDYPGRERLAEKQTLLSTLCLLPLPQFSLPVSVRHKPITHISPGQPVTPAFMTHIVPLLVLCSCVQRKQLSLRPTHCTNILAQECDIKLCLCKSFTRPEFLINKSFYHESACAKNPRVDSS